MRWSRELLEKQTDQQVIKKLPASYQNRQHTTTLTTAPNLPHQRNPRTPTDFLKKHCHILTTPTPLRLRHHTAPNLILEQTLL
jgi:hypothetical protein